MVVLLAAAGLLMGQALPNRRTVDAEEFVLRDSAGTPRAVLSLQAEGAPTLAFFDASGKTRAWLCEGRRVPVPALADRAGNPRGLSEGRWIADRRSSISPNPRLAASACRWAASLALDHLQAAQDWGSHGRQNCAFSTKTEGRLEAP
jgi:hypothetical protein